MIDGEIAGTGNSRFLKSAITSATTWEEFRAALIAGTLPIDLNGINAAGWMQLATLLNKANLLSDATAALINTLAGSTPSTPDAAFADITNKTQAIWNGRVQIATGSYTGTGTYGSSNPTVITFDFAPILVMMNVGVTTFPTIIDMARLTTEYQSAIFYPTNNYQSPYSGYIKKSADGKSVYMYSTDSTGQFNWASTHYYKAIG